MFLYTLDPVFGSLHRPVSNLFILSDTNKDTIPLVSSCTCRWPRRAARQASCCFSSNFPLSLAVPALSATTLCTSRGPAKPQGVNSLKACSHTHLSTSLLPASVFCSSAKWLLCCRWIHYILEIFHPGSPGSLQHCSVPGSCYSPAYHRLQHVPGKPSFSFSICPCPSLTHFLPLPPSFVPLQSSLSDPVASSHNVSHVHSLYIINHCH